MLTLSDLWEAITIIVHTPASNVLVMGVGMVSAFMIGWQFALDMLRMLPNFNSDSLKASVLRGALSMIVAALFAAIAGSFITALAQP